jgi:hypothetical protein
LPAPVQLRINQLAKKIFGIEIAIANGIWTTIRIFSVTSKIFSGHSRNEKVIKDDGKSSTTTG